MNIQNNAELFINYFVAVNMSGNAYLFSYGTFS